MKTQHTKRSFPSPHRHARLARASRSPLRGGDDNVLNALRRVNTLRADYHQSANQNGNALWFILIAIALLGLLTVMMSRSGSSTNETGSYEQNVIAANEILSYAKNMENAVQGLLARGCSENELSFWHDSDGNGTEDASDDYFNPNSPTDHSCHIFDVAGAGMNFLKNTDFFPDGSWIATYSNIVAKTDFNGVGTNETNKGQEIYYIFELPQNIDKVNFCNAINQSSNLLTTIPTTSIWGVPKYKGSFPEYHFNNTAELNGVTTACINYSPDTTRYQFYHVLHAR